MKDLFAERARVDALICDLLAIAGEQKDTETKIAFRLVLNNLLGRLGRIYDQIQRQHLGELTKLVGEF